MKQKLQKLMTLLIVSVFTFGAYAADVDVTSKVGTSKDAWHASGGPVTIDGISMPEVFGWDASPLGDVMWQEVAGLENGKYTVELWANARLAHIGAVTENGQENCTFLFANNVEITIPVYHDGGLANNKSWKLEGVEVTNGTLKMGMTKKAAGSNWHTIQIKSLIYHASDAEALAIAKADLQAALDEANAVSPKKDDFAAAIATAQGVYDASENVDEVKAAVATLKAATKTAILGNASLDNPVLTDFVVNGTFDATTEPWQSTTGARNQGLASNQQGAFTGTFFENWNPDNYTGKIYQVIENIPNGVYELSICAFAEKFNASAQFVYANEDKVALATSAPTAYKVRTNVTDNKIEIGFIQTEAVNNWCGIDNVSLTYFGEKNLRGEFTAKAQEFYAYVEGSAALSMMSGVKSTYAFPLFDEIDPLLADIDNVTDMDKLEALMAQMDEATAAMNKAIVAYEEYKVYADLFWEADANTAKVINQEAADLRDMTLQNSNYIGMQATTAEAFQAATAELKQAYLTYIAYAIPVEGAMFDVTFKMVNPDFETNLDGWTGNKANRIGGEGYNGVGGIAEIGEWGASAWDASMSQTLNELPNGKYIVKASWMAATGIQMTFAANESAITVTGIGDQGGNIAKDGSVVEMGQGHRGWQYVEVEGLVENGTLTITVSSSSTTQQMWSNADAFELYYAGAEYVATTEISLDKEEVLIEEAGATVQLVATVLPEEATDKTVTWTSSDEDVATVDENGVVTAVSGGMTTITATTAEGFSATCKVTVKSFPWISTPEAPKYYTIASYNRGGYLTNVGEGKGTEHVAMTTGSFWYFTKANKNGGIYFCNHDGGFLAANKTVSETAGVWYVLPNGVNEEGFAISSSNPISNGSCIDANNSNTGVGSWHPSASDWEGTTWVFTEVPDIYAYFKDQAKAELDVLASVSSIYPDATEAKAAIDALEIEDIEQLNATLAQCVADYKNAAYQALEGKYFTINTPARDNGYMKMESNRVVGIAEANSPAAIWQFEYADGAVKVFNPYTEQYLCEPDNNNSVNVAVTKDGDNAGAYQLAINTKAENEAAKVKFTSNGKSVHMSGGAVLVRWNDGGASEWTVTEVTVDITKDIVDLLKANADNHAELPLVGQYTTAGYNALQEAKSTVTTYKQVADAIAAFEATKNLPIFTINSLKDYALGQSIYENEEGALKFKATDVTDKSMLWTFDMTATEVGVTDKVVVRNVATGNLFWGASFISVIETEPAVEGDGAFMFKTEGTGDPVHAQANGSSIVRWSSADANAVGGASTWTFAFVGLTNNAAYDLTDLAAPFTEQAMAFAGLQENASLSALPAVQEMWAEAMGVVEPLFAKVSNNELVLKADVEAAMATMTEIQAVVAYYGETFAAAKDEANAAMDKLNEDSDEFAALLGAINVSTVTTVTELEAKVEVITEVLEYLASLPEVDPNDYTSYIINADLSISYAEGATSEDWNLTNSKGIKDGYARISGKVFDFSQTITLPAGQYKMTAKAAYRFGGDEQAEFDAIQAGGNTHLAKLYAQTAFKNYEVNVMNRYEGASETDYANDNGSVTVNNLFVPNSSAAVKAWFDADQYVNELVFNVQEESEVKIGIAKDVESSDYTNIGAWTLTRLGDAEFDLNEEDFDLDAPAYTDVTAQYIVNADFSTADGWTGGQINTNDRVCEFYAGWGALDLTYGKLQQEVTLPAGDYRLTAKAFFRQGQSSYTDASKSMGYMFAGDNKVLVKTLGSVPGLSSYADNQAQAGTAFYTDNLYDNVLEFTLAEETTLNIGFETTFDEMKSWFIAGEVKLESVQAVPGALVPLFEAQAMEFCQYSNTAMNALPAVEAKWLALSTTVNEIYGAIAEGKKVLDAEVKRVMAEMTALMAELVALDEVYAVYNDTKWAIFDIQDNSTANSDEARAAFDAAVEAASNVSSVTTAAELEAKIAEFEAARQAYVLNAVPTNGFTFDYTFKVGTSKAAWNCTGNEVIIDGIVMPENFQDTSTELGDLLWQTVTGLQNGQYTVELWANARVAWRASTATDGQEELTYLFANNVEKSMQVFLNPDLNNNASYVLEEVIVIDGTLKMGMTKKAAGSNWHTIQIKSLSYVGSLPESVLLELKKEVFVAKAMEFAPAVESFQLGMIATSELYPVLEIVQSLYENLDNATLAELEEAITAMDAATALMNEANDIYAEYKVFVNLFKDASEMSEPATMEAAELLEYNMYGTGAMMATSVNDLAQRVEWIKEDYLTYVSNAYTIGDAMFDVTLLVANAEVTSAEGWTNAEGRIINNTEYTGAPDKAAFDAGWWAGVIDIHQVLPTLPAGNYVLSAVARSASPESYLYAKSGETEVKTTLPQNGDQGGELGNGWANVSTETINVVEGETLTIGVYINNPGTNFAAADNFKLYYSGKAYVEVSEIYITPTWGQLYEVGQTVQLTATINPEDATDKTLVWSSDVDFVTVDENGLVTVVAPGEGMVTITATASNGVSGSCYFSAYIEDPNAVEVTLNKWVVEIEHVGETFQLVATVTPADADVVITWSSSNEAVATVDENGLVTAVGVGEADIIVYVNGEEAGTCWVEVLNDVPNGIDNIEADSKTVIYDLSGRRVNEMTKGIYIVNGKKVIKK